MMGADLSRAIRRKMSRYGSGEECAALVDKCKHEVSRLALAISGACVNILDYRLEK